MKNKHRTGSEEWYSSLKKGDVLYESSCGQTIEVKLLEDAKKTFDDDGSWRVEFIAECGNGEIDYLISQIGLNYGGGRLSEMPEYLGPILRLDGTTDLNKIF